MAIVLLALRDCGVLVWVALGPKPGRVEGATLLYVFLLWTVIPHLLDVFSGALASAVMPLGRVHGVAATVIILVHVVIVWGAAALRWRRMDRAYDGA